MIFLIHMPITYNRTVLIVNGDNQDIHSFEDLEGKRTANTISGTYAAKIGRAHV